MIDKRLSFKTAKIIIFNSVTFSDEIFKIYFITNADSAT